MSHIFPINNNKNTKSEYLLLRSSFLSTHSTHLQYFFISQLNSITPNFGARNSPTARLLLDSSKERTGTRCEIIKRDKMTRSAIKGIVTKLHRNKFYQCSHHSWLYRVVNRGYDCTSELNNHPDHFVDSFISFKNQISWR